MRHPTFKIIAGIVVGILIGVLTAYISQRPPRVYGALVNHHLFAPRLISDTLESIRGQNPSVVVLIAPNHFSTGHFRILSSRREWGTIKPANKIISALTEKQKLIVEEKPFEGEHGIYNIVPYIAQVAPNATIVPIILKDSATHESVDALAHELNKLLPPDAVIIGSFDFAHYLPSDVAEFHDHTSRAAITNFNYDAVDYLDIDSRPGLRLTLKLLEARGAQKFNLIANTNSGKMMNDKNTFETTSYIVGTFTKGPITPDPTKTLLVSTGPLPEALPRFKFGQDVTVTSTRSTHQFGHTYEVTISNGAIGFVITPTTTRQYIFPFDVRAGKTYWPSP